jgi:hypothetical protein
MMTTKQKRKELRAKHLKNLSVIFGIEGELLEVCFRSLKDIEHAGRIAATKYCNGELTENERTFYLNKLKNNFLASLKYAKSGAVNNCFFNWDPRGYFLKINDSYIRENNLIIETDWGGFGIICPEGI